MPAVQKIFRALGTLNTVTVFHADEAAADRAAERIRQDILSCDSRLSIFKSDSVISRMNAVAYDRPFRVSPDVFSLIRLSLEMCRSTGGAFDITAKRGMKGTGADSIVTDPGDLTVRFTRRGISVDLGGIAKGYCADRARLTLEECGIDEAVIDLGGTLLVTGSERTVGIRSPFSPLNAGGSGEAAAKLTLSNAVCVTSGQYEQAGHIVDPATGKAAETGILSATLTGASGAELDALATACIVTGLEGSVKLISARHAEGVFILEDGRICATEGLKERLKLTAGK